MLLNPCLALSSTTRVVILMKRSIMGETRLMKEMATHIRLVYICVKPVDSSGDPPRTPEGATLDLQDYSPTRLFWETETASSAPSNSWNLCAPSVTLITRLLHSFSHLCHSILTTFLLFQPSLSKDASFRL